MCGVAGFVLGESHRFVPSEVLSAMANAVRHRGPDAEGIWFDANVGVGLAHRRLAIVDLTAAGAQPMRSRSGRFTISFNGEVYNFEEIRRELASCGGVFVSNSDTEVLLAAIERWGIEPALRRAIGMFAFALWDSQDQVLTLARDRLGKKPLYVGMASGSCVFASELKALRAFPGLCLDIDRAALAQFMRHSYVPAPRSIYAGISKLPAASTLQIRRNGRQVVVGEPMAYWQVPDQHAIATAPARSEAAYLEELDSLLRDAVRLRMHADVPLGAFLSGGIDSSVVTALMQIQSIRPVKTFSIGFTEREFDEAPYAREVARHLGTDHTEVYVSSNDALAVIPTLPEIYDEPFSDSSQIPTYLVSKIARQAVVVALSGDGGDELFCGYTRYQRWRRLWANMQRTPRTVRKVIARMLLGVSVGRWDDLYRRGVRIVPGLAGLPSPGDKLHKLAQVLACDSPEVVYLRFLSHWNPPTELVLNTIEPTLSILRHTGRTGTDEFTGEMMRIDLENYLPDDILVKVDRASMAVSLEVRAPLLDHRVVEFAATLPLTMKLRSGHGKWLLRKLLYRHVPRQLVERPKMGFGIPVEAWLRGPLRGWAEHLLDPVRLRREGLLNGELIRTSWENFMAGRGAMELLLWDVLIFQAWLNREQEHVRSLEFHSAA